MGHQALFDNLADGKPGVERRVRILKDNLQILAQNPHLVIREAGQIDALITHSLVAVKFPLAGILGAKCVYLYRGLGRLSLGLLQRLDQHGTPGLQLPLLLLNLGSNFLRRQLGDMIQIQVGLTKCAGSLCAFDVCIHTRAVGRRDR